MPPLAVLREIGVETGGSNVQFGICPDTGRSGSDRNGILEFPGHQPLASKGNRFPDCQGGSKLAVGFTLDELQNDITGGATRHRLSHPLTTLSQNPRFTFEKFPQADERLTTQMKSVGK